MGYFSGFFPAEPAPESLPGEEWAQVQGFPDYAVSTEGRVWSMKSETGQMLTQYTNESGVYAVVKLYRNGESKQHLVHVLVANHFPDEVEGKEMICEGCHVHHQDGDPTNNATDNLAILSPEQHRAAQQDAPGDELAVGEDDTLQPVDDAPF